MHLEKLNSDFRQLIEGFRQADSSQVADSLRRISVLSASRENDPRTVQFDQELPADIDRRLVQLYRHNVAPNVLYVQSVEPNLSLPIKVSLSPHILDGSKVRFIKVEPTSLDPQTRSNYLALENSDQWLPVDANHPNRARGRGIRRILPLSSQFYHNIYGIERRPLQLIDQAWMLTSEKNIWVRVQIRRLPYQLPGFENLEGHTGEWIEQVIDREQDLPSSVPVQEVAGAKEMDQIFEDLGLYRRGWGAAPWNYKEPHIVEGVALVEKQSHTD